MLRTQLRQYADSLQSNIVRNIASLMAGPVPAICEDRQVIGIISVIWKRMPRVLGRSLHPRRTHRAPASSNGEIFEPIPEVVRRRTCQLSAWRKSATVAIAILSLCCIHGAASTPIVSQKALASLQAKADQAQPRDRCFLYAMLVNQMTNLAGQQFDSDDPRQASESLKQIQRYIEKVRTGMNSESRKVKDAELLIQRSGFQLRNILRESSFEDHLALDTTLNELNQVQEQLMIQVFKK